jgi:hypothetical protein
VKNRATTVTLKGFVFPLFALALAFIQGSHSARKPSLSVNQETDASPLCPYRTPEQWDEFLQRVADNPKWVETCEDSACDEAYYVYVKQTIQDTFEKCAAYIRENPAIESCTRNLRTFTPPWMRQHDIDSYGFAVDNHTYNQRQETLDLPKGMMKVPEPIVRALPDRAAVEEVARKNGWKYLSHDSALGNYRTFVIVSDPQGEFDQWLLLNLSEGDTKVAEGQPVSVLSVQKTDADGRPLNKTRVHFRDYAMARSQRGYYLSLPVENNGKCFSCHPAGMRQLIARRTPILEAKPTRGEPGYDETGALPSPPDFAYRRLIEFNQKIRSYGNPDWGEDFHPENYGPALGAAQGCTDCHDGRSRGVLTVALSHQQLEQKLYDELSMPPDEGLPALLERDQMKNPEVTSEEKENLEKAFLAHSKLTKEFEASRFPLLRKWFLEKNCQDAESLAFNRP